jgi:hypothetical protein
MGAASSRTVERKWKSFEHHTALISVWLDGAKGYPGGDIQQKPIKASFRGASFAQN